MAEEWGSGQTSMEVLPDDLRSRVSCGAFDFAASLVGVLARHGPPERVRQPVPGDQPGQRGREPIFTRASARPGDLTRAVERALEPGMADADAVRPILVLRREEPVGLFCLDRRPHLRLVGVPTSRPTRA
jgi:hypothetical protein